MNKPKKKIVTIYRLKNEERWIKKSLEAVSQISDEIIILDDDSTDSTIKICENFPNVVDIHKQNNLLFDESRDKNILLTMALKRTPDFILTLDGDEIIQPCAERLFFEDIDILYPDSPMYEFQVLNIWDKPNQYRYDGNANILWAKKLIRISKQPNHLFFENTKYLGNAHCPAVPQNAVGHDISIRSRMKIFHYGRYDDELRLSSLKFMQALDPNNPDFDNYQHITSGKGRFSGSKGLEFKIIPEEMYYDFK